MSAEAQTPQAITREHGLELLSQMLRIRCFEDRCVELYSGEKIRGFLHLYNGEEAIAVGVIRTLQPLDAIAGTYREHGHAIVRGVPMRTIMAELFGKLDGCCRGRGGSMHIFDPARRFYGGSAIVGGNLPLAVGLGLAEKLRGRNAIAVCFFGEGAMAEGGFHETMNLAALWQVPVLFVCENNLYAMGTALSRSQSQVDLLAKLSSYVMRGESVDGMDVFAVERCARQLVDFVRGSQQPAFMEARTYRLRAHSMYDPQLYRSRSEVKEWEERGPLITLTRRMKELGLMTEDDFQRLQDAANAEVDDAVRFAENSPLEPVEDLERFVYAQAVRP